MQVYRYILFVVSALISFDIYCHIGYSRCWQ